MKFAILASLLMSGCAAKQHHAKLPLKGGTNIQFKGIKNGKCAVADVLLDAKTGGYTVICK